VMVGHGDGDADETNHTIRNCGCGCSSRSCGPRRWLWKGTLYDESELPALAHRSAEHVTRQSASWLGRDTTTDLAAEYRVDEAVMVFG